MENMKMKYKIYILFFYIFNFYKSMSVEFWSEVVRFIFVVKFS